MEKTRPPLNLNTFSIVAYDPASNMFGVATSTKFPAVGALVPYVRAGVGAIATQARVNPLLGCDGLNLLERGRSAEETLKILLGSDPEPEKRQVCIVDARGLTAAHTGVETDPWRGHLAADNYAVTGNLLVGGGGRPSEGWGLRGFGGGAAGGAAGTGVGGGAGGRRG